MSRKPLPFFTFFNFSSDEYNKFHIGLSQQHYPEDITHDDDQLSTKTTRDREDDGIRRYHTRWWSTIHETHTMKTTQDHEDDGIMETEEDFEEKESLFEDIMCHIL